MKKSRLDLHAEAKDRVKILNFGDPLTNVCAGDNNPRRHSYFVENKINSRRNKFGITHTERFVKCTDKNGSFWETDPIVIYPGHISYEESNKIFKPIHAVLYSHD